MSEKDFLPHVRCDNCGELVSIYDTVGEIVMKGGAEIELEFCGEYCRQEHMLNLARRIEGAYKGGSNA